MVLDNATSTAMLAGFSIKDSFLEFHLLKGRFKNRPDLCDIPFLCLKTVFFRLNDIIPLRRNRFFSPQMPAGNRGRRLERRI